jgi:DNA-binding transcriptional ArsR family regulator
MNRAAPGPLDAAFSALADSTRRAMIRQLLREPLRAGELAQRVEMSPPALSRHLRVLRAAGLIVEEGVKHDARVRVYKVNLETFTPVRHWLDEVEAHWHEQLAAFKTYAEQSRTSTRAETPRASAGQQRAPDAPAAAQRRTGSARPRAEEGNTSPRRRKS